VRKQDSFKEIIFEEAQGFHRQAVKQTVFKRHLKDFFTYKTMNYIRNSIPFTSTKMAERRERIFVCFLSSTSVE